MQILWVVILIIWAVAVNANKKKKVAQKNAAAGTVKQPVAPVNRGVASATKTKTTQSKPQKHVAPAPAIKPAESYGEGFAHKEERDGSINMPPREAHEHEGKPMPCPADEREAPRPRPAELANQPETVRPNQLQVVFSKNAVLEGVIMSEVLKRPEFHNGRRVYR